MSVARTAAPLVRSVIISKALEAVRKRFAKAGLEADVSATKDGDEIKLFIRRGRNQVKVELNHVFAAL